MSIWITLLSIIIISLSAGFLWFQPQLGTSVTRNIVQKVTPTSTLTPTPTQTPVPQTKIIPQKLQVYQSFNNCGPANLSMLLSYFNVNVTQESLGRKLRPYQNLQGDNDDKSVTLQELAAESQNYGFVPYHRANGNLEVTKKFIANDIPFIVRTWLNPNEDIGHYRVVRGYDDITQEFIQDDSYQGDNIRYSYGEFNEMWQPFNYEYLVIVLPEKEELVRQILGENADEKMAWQNALEFAQQEENGSNPYPIFNQSVAYYYLGDYQKSVEKYEEVQNKLPNRMLWYQIEPIKAYLETKQYDKVFSLTDAILNNHNRGFTELYLLRGKSYEEQGNIEAAKVEYEKAVFYNVNSEEAKSALTNVSTSL